MTITIPADALWIAFSLVFVVRAICELIESFNPLNDAATNGRLIAWSVFDTGVWFVILCNIPRLIR